MSEFSWMRSQNHRLVWVGRDLKAHPVPALCHGQGHLPLDQVAQSPIQPGLDHCQGWDSHSFSGQPVPGPHHPHREELVSNLNFPSFSSKPFPLFCYTMPLSNASLHLSCQSLYVLEAALRSPLKEPSLLQAEQAQLSQPVCIGEVLQP